MMFYMLGHYHHLELKEMLSQEELMKLGLKQKELELFTDSAPSFVG